VAPEPPAPAHRPRRALDLGRPALPQRAPVELVRGSDASQLNDWAAYEASDCVERPPRKGLDMRREAFLAPLEQDFLAGAAALAMQQKAPAAAPAPDQAPQLPAPAPPAQPQPPSMQEQVAHAQAQAIADVWSQFAEVELPAPAQKPPAPAQQPPAPARALPLPSQQLLAALPPIKAQPLPKPQPEATAPVPVPAQKLQGPPASRAPGQQAPIQVVATAARTAPRPPAGSRTPSGRGECPPF
jgi:hypothetical protein